MEVRVGEGGHRGRGRPRIHGPRAKSTSGRGVTLHSQAREFLKEFFEQEEKNMLLHNEPLILFNQVMKRIACALEISERSISRICKGKRLQSDPSHIVTPGKERPRAPQLDSLQLDAIRRHKDIVNSNYFTRIENNLPLF